MTSIQEIGKGERGASLVVAVKQKTVESAQHAKTKWSMGVLGSWSSAVLGGSASR